MGAERVAKAQEKHFRIVSSLNFFSEISKMIQDLTKKSQKI